MSNIKDKDIIQEVKETLNIFEEISDIKLLEALKKSVAHKHPDNFTDDDTKKQAEEECKKLTALYNDLKKYIEQNIIKNKSLVTYDQNDIIRLSHINETDEKDKEIANLKAEKGQLESQLKISEDNIQSLNKKIDDLYNLKTEDNKQEIKEMYRPRKPVNVVGITVLAATIGSVIPQCKDLLENIGLSSGFISISLLVISSLWLLSWLRSLMVEKIVDSVESYIVTSQLEDELYIRQREKRYYKESEQYFTEKDLSNCIRKLLKKGLRKYLIMYDMNKTVRVLTEQIILEFNRKKLIKSTETDGLTKVFVLDTRNEFCF